MNLDRRAAQAARSLRASVAGVAPVPIPAIVGRQRRSLVTSFAVAAAAVMFIVGAAAAMPRLFEPDQVATNTTIPDGTTPIVVEPDDKENDDNQLVDLDPDVEVLAVRMTRSVSDSPEPYTVFYGTGEPGSSVTIVSAYAETVGDVNGEGHFEIKVWFEPRPPAGEEFPILVTVDGQEYEFAFVSTYDPENIDITANQTYGASDDAEAYEKFFGTAPPGTEIIATSPFGTADAVADEHGRWKLKLWFSALPFDEPFDVTLTVGGETFTFPFVSVYAVDDLPLSINQVNSVSDSPNPFVQFVGTAPVGTHLLVQSEYGAHDVVVGESGEFSLKVWFSPLPPAGEQFPLTFKVNHEFYGTYYFKSLYENGGGSEGVEVDQYNTESWDAEPWVKFHVYGPGGTQVQILSPYGSITQSIESSGDYVRLYFSSLPPAGEEFQVTVKINGETFGTYPFTSWFNGEPIVEAIVTSWDSADSPYAKVEYWIPDGVTLQLTSAYGSSDVVTKPGGGGGHLKLWFSETLPVGEEFAVTVKIDGETHGTFGYVNYYDPEGGVEITVNHSYFTCSEADPYDFLWGTAPEGSEVKIISEYGSSTFTVGESGEWEKTQYFEGAPFDEQFLVKVKVNGAVYEEYWFTVLEPEG